MRKYLTLAAATAVVVTGCSQPREYSSVDVTPPPTVEVPTQTVFYQAVTSVMHEDALVSTGQPAIDSLNNATAELAQYSPEPAECAGIIAPELYTTDDVVMGFHSQSEDEEHIAQTVVAAGFETAEEASAYFTARTEPWIECPSVDLTIDDTNVLTLHYEASAFAETPELEVPAVFDEADEDMVLSSSGELSGAFENPNTDAAAPNPGSLPDYVIPPEEVPEPEPENISVTNATVVARFDTQVFWTTIEPGAEVDQAIETLGAVVEAVQAEQ